MRQGTTQTYTLTITGYDLTLTRLEWRTHPPDYAAIGGDINDR